MLNKLWNQAIQKKYIFDKVDILYDCHALVALFLSKWITDLKGSSRIFQAELSNGV